METDNDTGVLLLVALVALLAVLGGLYLALTDGDAAPAAGTAQVDVID